MDLATVNWASMLGRWVLSPNRADALQKGGRGVCLGERNMWCARFWGVMSSTQSTVRTCPHVNVCFVALAPLRASACASIHTSCLSALNAPLHKRQKSPNTHARAQTHAHTLLHPWEAVCKSITLINKYTPKLCKLFRHGIRKAQSQLIKEANELLSLCRC